MPTGSRAPSGATDYVDFVIHGRRTTRHSVEIGVYTSPVGPLARAATVAFSVEEASTIRQSFRADLAQSPNGCALITQAEAAALGKRMASVLLPTPVVELLARSLGQVLRRPAAGLRLRLALDEALNDLPWEYVQRPDRVQGEGLSGFLLLDPRISLVREAAQPRIALEPITGKQRLAVVGTLWEGKADIWKVGEEYQQLEAALKPVARYIRPSYAEATSRTAFAPSAGGDVAIFHYAGHCDFDREGRAFLVREMPSSGDLEKADRVYVDALAPSLRKTGARLVVLSACNSGFWATVKPLLDAEVPAIVAVNGAVASSSTIEFCTKLYESLAVGLTLDEALSRARLHVLEWGRQYQLFDWGLYMAYMPSPQAELFPRARTRSLAGRQTRVRLERDASVESVLRLARELDGLNFSEIVSEMTKRRVLILGAFKGRRLKVLEAIKRGLADHPNKYIPELFTYRKPDLRDLTESVVAFASLSRFVVADLSEPRTLPGEIEAIVPRLQSVPLVPLINRTGKEYAGFSSIKRRPNVVQPTFRYRDLEQLQQQLDEAIVQAAEAKLHEVRPDA